MYICIDPTQEIDGADSTVCQNNGMWIPSTLGSCTDESKTTFASQKI